MFNKLNYNNLTTNKFYEILCDNYIDTEILTNHIITMCYIETINLINDDDAFNIIKNNRK